MGKATTPTIIMTDTDSLIPYINNARTHSQTQINQIAASIKEFGFINPVIIDGDKGIIAGHGRVMAAKKLGLAEVPCIQASHLTEAQKKAYILADNKIALNADWDEELLRLELQSLDDLDFDLELTGFDLDEVEAIQFDDASGVDFPVLSDSGKLPFQQKTFTLHDEQAALVDEAIMKASQDPLCDTGLNENKNGNALAFICNKWLGE